MTRFDESRKNVNKVRLWFYLLNHFLYLCLTNNQTMRTWYAYLIKINFKKRDKIKDNFTPEKVSVSPWILDKNGLTDRCGMVWQKMLFFLVNCIFLRNHDNSKRVTNEEWFRSFLFFVLYRQLPIHVFLVDSYGCRTCRFLFFLKTAWIFVILSLSSRLLNRRLCELLLFLRLGGNVSVINLCKKVK